MIHADTFVSTGAANHAQDYAAKSADGNTVAISDGCSSSPHTCVGARALVHSALLLLTQDIGRRAMEDTQRMEPDNDSSNPLGNVIGMYNDRFGDAVISRAMQAMSPFPGMSDRSLDATLGVIHAAYEPGMLSVPVSVFLWGDGVIILREASGNIRCLHEEYGHGTEGAAPFYLSYRMGGARRANYDATCAFPLVETEEIVRPGSTHQFIHQRHYSAGRCLSGVILTPGDTMLICTDGINQFRQGQTPIPWLDIARQITDFKRLGKEFVQSRMVFFNRHCKKQGIIFDDDFAVAAIHNDGTA